MLTVRVAVHLFGINLERSGGSNLRVFAVVVRIYDVIGKVIRAAVATAAVTFFQHFGQVRGAPEIQATGVYEHDVFGQVVVRADGNGRTAAGLDGQHLIGLQIGQHEVVDRVP